MGQATGFRAPKGQLRLARMMRGYSLADLARRADVSIATVSAVELGNRRASPQVARRLARALGSSLKAMIDEGALIAETDVDQDGSRGRR